MRAGREIHTRHAGLIEARHVGRLIRIFLQRQIKACRHVRSLQQACPHRTRASGLYRELVVVHPSDHVEVEIGRELIHRNGWCIHERRRADEPNLLRGPQRHDQMATTNGLFAQGGRDGEHRRTARRVVVRAQMRLAGVLLAGERVAVASESEVIVVCADHDPRLDYAGHGTRRREIRHDIAPRLLLANERRLQRERDLVECEPCDMRIAAVQLLLNRLQRFRRAGEQGRSDGAAHTGGGNTRSGERSIERHRNGLSCVR